MINDWLLLGDNHDTLTAAPDSPLRQSESIRLQGKKQKKYPTPRAWGNIHYFWYKGINERFAILGGKQGNY